MMKVIRGLLTAAGFNFDGFVVAGKIGGVRRKTAKFGGHFTESWQHMENTTTKTYYPNMHYYHNSFNGNKTYVYVNINAKSVFSCEQFNDRLQIVTDDQIYNLTSNTQDPAYYTYYNLVVRFGEGGLVSHSLIGPVGYKPLDERIMAANFTEIIVYKKWK